MTCEYCGSPLPSRKEPRGRPAKYCRQTCREMAYRQRRAERVREFGDMLMHENATRSELVEAFLRISRQ